MIGIGGLSIELAGGNNGPRSDTPKSPAHASGPIVPSSFPRPLTTAIGLPSGPQFDQVVAGGGKVFVFGNTNPGAPCNLALIDATTLLREELTIPECGVWGTYGDGAALLFVGEFVRGTAAEFNYHLERVDPTGRAAIFSPVDFVFDGSAIAHGGFAYGDGGLWIDGMDGGVPTLVEVSPRSADIEQRWSLPSDASAFSLTAGSAGAFVAPGPGTQKNFGLLLAAPGVARLRVVSTLSGAMSTGLATSGSDVLAIETIGPRQSLVDQTRQELLQFNRSGKRAFSRSLPVSFETWSPLVGGPGGDLWGLTPTYTTCRSESLVAIDPSSGSIADIDRLSPPGGACYFGGLVLVAASGSDLFVLAAPASRDQAADLVEVKP